MYKRQQHGYVCKAGAHNDGKAGAAVFMDRKHLDQRRNRGYEPVSYTHLDVYKRQVEYSKRAVTKELIEVTAGGAFKHIHFQL